MAMFSSAQATSKEKTKARVKTATRFMRICIFRVYFYLASFLNVRFVFSYYGPKFVANFKDLTFKFYILGSYGDFYFKHLSSYPEDFVFLDIGANQGLYTLASLQNSNNKYVYAVEPVIDTYKLLSQNISLNSAPQRVRLGNFAINSNSGYKKISKVDGHSGAATLRNLQRVNNHSQGEIVECISKVGMEKFVEHQSYPIIAKIDVEGLEEEVIQVLLECNFGPQIKEIFFEVNEDWTKVEHLLSILESYGFSHVMKFGDSIHYDLLATRNKFGKVKNYS